MSILAGIYSRNKNKILEQDCLELSEKLSRNNEDRILTYKDDRVFLAKINIGAFDAAPIHAESSGSISMLAGEPLLSFDSTSQCNGRYQDQKLLHESWDQDNWELTIKTHGVFCAVYYKPQEERLTLISDKLGIRPLYYWVGDEYVVFASALRILENVHMVTKIMDIRAISEIISLEYPLGSRTPYINTALLNAAEYIHIAGKEITSSIYWRWDSIQPSTKTEKELLNEVYDRFEIAVARRLQNSRKTIAFLSGGLDSRCVVALLKKQNADVISVDFSLDGTQDRQFSSEFAEMINSVHVRGSMEMWPSYSKMMKHAIDNLLSHHAVDIEKPRLAWSGDGGSVGLGHVYINENIVELLRNGKYDDAIQSFLEQQKAIIPQGVLKKTVFHELVNLPAKGIREELDRLHCSDPGRSFYIFLMLNDQRRHLCNHFEDQDIHRLEFNLPFFDGDFIALITSIPIDLCLLHRLYVKWLYLLPNAVASVPWQAYPGHVQCPLPVQNTMSSQWQKDHLKSVSLNLKQNYLKRASVLLNSKNFPDSILNRKKLYLAKLVYKTGLRDYGYLVKMSEIIYKYWSVCDGNYSQ